MKTCVIGGGNIGTLLAAEFAHKGYEVAVYTSDVTRWSKKISVYSGEEQFLFESELSLITSDLEMAVKDAETIWVTLPAFMLQDFSKKVEPYVVKGQKVIVTPGCGAEFAMRNLVEQGCTLCGLQRVHSIARLKKYGHSVYMLGRKPESQVGTVPAKEAAAVANLLAEMLDMPCVPLCNYLTVTLTPSNPILHTTRIYSMFREDTESTLYDHNILFYEEWTDATSELMIRCDEELQQVCKALAPLDLTGVKSMRVHYESDTAEKMTKKISGIPAFRGLTSPMKPVDGGWRPDYASRYFTADFPYGLKIMVDVAGLVGIPVPNMEIVWNWYVDVVHPEHFFQLQFKSVDELIRYYQ